MIARRYTYDGGRRCDPLTTKSVRLEPQFPHRHSIRTSGAADSNLSCHRRVVYSDVCRGFVALAICAASRAPNSRSMALDRSVALIVSQTLAG